MEILAIAIQKGGTGKTTTAAAIAQAARYKGKKVLAIDLDPQGNLTFAMGADAASGSSFDLLHGANAADLIQTISPGLDVIPASWNLLTEATEKGSATRLKKALEPLKKKYGLIVIDTPPTAGELQYNALCAATSLLIPLEADIYNLQGLYQMVDTARHIKQNNKDLKQMGFIITKLDGRSVIVRQMQEQIIVAANKVGVNYLGSVRKGVVVQEAAALQQDLYEYAPRSKAAQDYLAILSAGKYA